MNPYRKNQDIEEDSTVLVIEETDDDSILKFICVIVLAGLVTAAIVLGIVQLSILIVGSIHYGLLFTITSLSPIPFLSFVTWFSDLLGV